MNPPEKTDDLSMTTIATLSDALRGVILPIFETLPPARAMRDLVVTRPADDAAVAAVEQAIADGDLLEQAPELAAGLWLYVDDLERSHAISQGLDTPTGSFWHAIMHRREGDFSNSRYWFRRVGQHPAFARIHLAGGPGASGTDEASYDPVRLVDAVEKAAQRGDIEHHPELLAMHRHEWFGLFEWCVEHTERTLG